MTAEVKMAHDILTFKSVQSLHVMYWKQLSKHNAGLATVRTQQSYRH